MPLAIDLIEMKKRGFQFLFAFILCSFFVCSVFAQSKETIVQKGIKYAVMNLEKDLSSLQHALKEAQVKQTFSTLFNVSPAHLVHFVDEDILADALRRIDKEVTLPLHKERLRIISEILLECSQSETIVRLFTAYHSSTRVLFRKNVPATFASTQGNNALPPGLNYAVAKGLERVAAEEIAVVLNSVHEVFDTRVESLEAPLEILKAAQVLGVELLPTDDIRVWHLGLAQVKPNLFRLDDVVHNHYYFTAHVRKIFSNPHYLYQYLIKKHSVELISSARKFIEAYEQQYKPSERVGSMTPRQWSAIYRSLASLPELRRGIFSLKENAVYYDYHEVMNQFSDSHALYCSKVIAEAFQKSPDELMVVLRHILSKQNLVTDLEASQMTHQQFMQLLIEGKLPLFEAALKRLKAVKQILSSLEKHILYSNQPLKEDTMVWAENAVNQSIGHIEQMWEALGLPMRNLDALTLKEGMSDKGLNRIVFTREIFGKLFGEDYMRSLKVLREHMRQMRTIGPCEQLLS